MRPTCTLLLLACLALRVSAVDSGELPLRIVAAGVADTPLPALAVGSGELTGAPAPPAPAPAIRWLPALGDRHATAEAVAHLFGLEAPVAKRGVLVLATLPLPWRPTVLLREGELITLKGEAVRVDDQLTSRALDEPDWAKPDQPHLFALALDALDPGDYRLSLEVAQRTRIPERATLRQMGLATGLLPFHIPAAGDSAKPAAPRLERTIDAMLAVGDAPGWLVPRCRLVENGGRGETQGLLGVGTAEVSDAGAVRVHPPVSDDIPTAVVIGPQLGSGEWMALRSVQERRGAIDLEVVVWRDDGPRVKNVPHTDALLVPVAGGGKPAPTVSVHWVGLRAKTFGGVYQREAQAPGGHR
jgi:hypothetical protein